MITTGHRYFLYARKSSESKDRQMASIPDQVKEVQRLASELNLDIVEIITESRSAKAPGRPAFDNMLLRIQQGEANGILCWKLNRLARNPVDGGQISWMLQQGIIQHIQCYGRDYKPLDNVLMMQVEFGMANQYVKDLSIDVKRGMRLKAERGWYPSRSLPIGYQHNKSSYRRVLPVEIIPDEKFNTVKKLWKLLLTGDYSVVQIKKVGDDLGLTGHSGKPLPLKTYHTLFQSKFYCGYFNWKNADGVSIEYEGMHEKMLSLEDYEKAQDILLGRSNQSRSRTHDFLFKGVLTCGECGCMVSAERKRHVRCKKCKKKFSCIHRDDCPKCHTLPDSSKIFERVYYRCSKKKGPCSQKYVSESELKLQYRNAIESITTSKEFHEIALKVLKEHSHVSKGNAEKDAEALGHQKTKLESRLKRLTLMRADGEIGSEELNAVRQEVVFEIQEKERQIQKMLKADIQWRKYAEEYLNIACNALEAFDSGDISMTKSVLSKIGSNHTLIDQKAQFIWVKPLLAIQKCHQAYEAEKARFEPQNPHEKQGDCGGSDTPSDFQCAGKSLIRTTFYKNRGLKDTLFKKIPDGN